MDKPFVELLLFQVKPEKYSAFETLMGELLAHMEAQPGCTRLVCFKRFYTFDGVELGQPPRELTKIVKCIKCFALWQFDTIEACGKANGWLMENHYRELVKLLIAPFDINSGYAL